MFPYLFTALDPTDTYLLYLLAYHINTFYSNNTMDPYNLSTLHLIYTSYSRSLISFIPFTHILHQHNILVIHLFNVTYLIHFLDPPTVIAVYYNNLVVVVVVAMVYQSQVEVLVEAQGLAQGSDWPNRR